MAVSKLSKQVSPKAPSSLSTSQSFSNKRKREPENELITHTEKKAAKRRKQKKPKEIHDEDLNEELGINVAFSRMDSRLLADYIAQRTLRFGERELSTVELADRHFPENAIQDTSQWDKPRTLENFASFFKHFSNDSQNDPELPKGSPRALVITASGLRAADISRALKNGLAKKGEERLSIAKLFAKHIKFPEAVKMCNTMKIDIGVGTPHRISELITHGALSAASLESIIMDVSHIDQKKRGILDMKDLHMALVDLLIRDEFKVSSTVWNNRIKVLFY
ncbi:hypothetical protein AOQ84DRAFT_443158 [Glonium stellatum]|uniref:Uncharacterized protein n=1 Tax=Glonium stellatum TaxID=574774 RepID=A0A8E2JML0_9PEZI|nr:hypothetical protein AOQ84DRAFT_443158 [Glonium stellatum]